MREIKKRIVIASVLKPLNDTRMTEKIASTLADDPSYDIHVIGFPSAIPADAQITFHTFPAFKRLSFARWCAPFRVLRSMWRIRPTVIIVTTHELLIAGVIAKIFLRARLVYDVQENYYLNTIHSNGFPVPLRIPIAWYIRLKESVASLFVDHFFLAEAIYSKQLLFTRDKYTLLPNKAKVTNLPAVQRVPMQLIFTGTLSRSTGVFRAIELAKKLHASVSSVSLLILGYASIESERNEITRHIHGCDFIKLVGGDHLVNHAEIVRAISTASAGIIAYDLNPATSGRIPTKLYEYLAYQLPIIFIESDPAWRAVSAQTAGENFALSGVESEISNLLTWLRQPHGRGTFPETLSWKNEESALRTAISAL